ncbi:TRAP transporter small permease [Rhodobacterales bacterium]|nr:TRAP transporter small permease [Rhodobacterales bacterium]
MIFLRFCEKACEAIVAFFMLILVVMVFVNVVLRFGFSSGIVVTEELSRIVLSALIMVGALLALIQQRHIAMTLLVDRFPAPVKKVLVMVTGSLMLYCNWLLTSGGWTQAELNFSSQYPISGLPMATTYLIASAAGVAFSLVILARMVLILAGRMPAERFFQAASTD